MTGESTVYFAASISFLARRARYKRAVGLYRYAPDVFITPPWEEIYVSDRERPKPFREAVGEYETLLKTYENLGYRTTLIPHGPILERADFVEARFI